ncbi:MAG: CBS and ACT domain-containing protein [Candidatus Methylomirabilales bacterium]
MLVRERMSKNPYTITADMSVAEALRRMHEVHVRRFPVLDKSGKLVGIVAEKDLLYASPSPATSLSIYEIHYLLSKLTVAQVMKKEVITVTEDTPVEDAARIMTDRKIGSLPVVRDGQLVGIITETDLFRLFQELLGARKKGVRLTLLLPEVKGTLAKITTAIAQKGGNIIALGTFLGEDPTNSLVAIKVADVPKDTLVETLKPLVVAMIDVREV